MGSPTSQLDSPYTMQDDHPVPTVPTPPQSQGEDDLNFDFGDPTATPDAADGAPSWDLDKLFELAPWFVLPNEMQTETKVDEASGKSYMFLHNAPVKNYLAYEINDGHELAAGGDVDYLIEFVRANLDPRERFHVVVIPDGNIQMAGVPRWQQDPDWLDKQVAGLKDSGDDNDEGRMVEGSNALKGATTTKNHPQQGKGLFLPTQQQQHVDHRQETESHVTEPPFSAFLPKKIYSESPPPPQRCASLPLQHKDTKIRQDSGLQSFQHVQSFENFLERAPLHAPEDRELALFQGFQRFNRARIQQVPEAERPKFSREELKLFKDFIRFLRLQHMGGDHYNTYPYQQSGHMDEYCANPVDGTLSQPEFFGNAYAEASSMPRFPVQIQTQPYMPNVDVGPAVMSSAQGQFLGTEMSYAPSHLSHYHNDSSAHNFIPSQSPDDPSATLHPWQRGSSFF